MRLHRLLLFMVLALTLSACGFHLRGRPNIPQWLHDVAIICPNNDKLLISLLESELDEYKIRVIQDLSLAKYWLIINNINLQQQIISIGSSTNPRQYSLILSLEFLLKTPKGQVLKSPGIVSAARQLTINNDRILGSTDEKNILINEMKQDLVIQIINRLNHVENG